MFEFITTRRYTHEPTTCARCGGRHFLEATFRQYRDGMYSSWPGGELFALPGSCNLLVCLCGEPLPLRTPGKLDRRKPEFESLERSLAQAVAFRTLEHLRAVLSKRAAAGSPDESEIEELARRIAQIDELVEFIRSPKWPAGKPEPQLQG